jgi:hypothetical protein
MEILLPLVVLSAVLGVLVWRPPRGRRGNLDQALEDDALRKERERSLTESIYRENRYNLPPRGRP